LAIAQGDAKDPAGTLNSPGGDLLVEVSGEVETLDRVMDIPVRAGAYGELVRVGDIADVRKTFTEPPTDTAYVDGIPAVVVAARVKDAIRVDQWATKARSVVEEFRGRVPSGLEVDLIFDQSEYVRARLDGLANNMLMAMALVVVVVFFMMGWRSAIAVGVALPLTSMMVLLGMKMLDIPMHQMSVTGLIVALGLLIDNAIVIVDEVRQRTAAGRSAPDAIASAVRHLAVPLFGSTFTTTLAFMPLVLMPGGAGEFVGTIGLSVILAITSSLFLALTVIPAIAGLINERHQSNQAHGLVQSGVFIAPLAAWYRRSLDYVLRYPLAGLVISVILPVLGFAYASTLPEQFFPPADRNQVQIELLLPTHASIERTEALAIRARELIETHPQVTRVHWFLGTSAPKFYYNMLETRDNAPYYAQALVELSGSKGDSQIAQDIQQMLDKAFPAAQLIVRQLEQGPPFDAPVELRLVGPDLDRLRELGEAVRTIMSESPHTLHTTATLTDGRPKLRLAVDDAEARVAGLDNTGIAVALRGNLTGATGGSLLEATEQLPVRVRLVETQRRSVADLPSINLTPGSASGLQGSVIPVAALGEIDLVPEVSAIPHHNGRRVNTVQAFITAGVLPSVVLNDVLNRLDDQNFELPAGYALEIAGESAERDTAVGNLLASVSLLAVMMIATLVLTFSSFRLAALLGASATLAMGLGMLALVVFGYPFGFMAIVGTMGLVGVAMNDSIVVLAAIRGDQAARRGDRIAIRNVVEHTTRHVLSTTATTVAGFMPLLLAGGDFWPPLAVAIGGGVVGATLLALVLIPSAYVLLMCRQAGESLAEEPAVNALPEPA
jgi:multidrug efflux pump subunit AcrB